MKYHPLGHTGLLVSAFSFGTMTFAGSSGIWKNIGQVDQAGADALVKAAFDAGINLFDTADIYARARAKAKIRISACRGRRWSSLPKCTAASAGPKRRRRLARAHHGFRGSEPAPPPGRSPRSLPDPRSGRRDPLEETLRALETLVQQGKVRYVGCSNWQAWKLARALGLAEAKNLARFDCLQAYYSLAGRDLERELVPLLQAEGTGLLVWSPLAGGLLSGKFSRENQKPAGSRRSAFDFPIVDKERAWKILDVIAPIARAHACSAARISLAWLLSKPVVTSIIIGAKRLEQLHDNLAAGDLTPRPRRASSTRRSQRPPARIPRLDARTAGERAPPGRLNTGITAHRGRSDRARSIPHRADKRSARYGFRARRSARPGSSRDV